MPTACNLPQRPAAKNVLKNVLPSRHGIEYLRLALNQSQGDLREVAHAPCNAGQAHPAFLVQKGLDLVANLQAGQQRAVLLGSR